MTRPIRYVLGERRGEATECALGVLLALFTRVRGRGTESKPGPHFFAGCTGSRAVRPWRSPVGRVRHVHKVMVHPPCPAPTGFSHRAGALIRGSGLSHARACITIRRWLIPSGRGPRVPALAPSDRLDAVHGFRAPLLGRARIHQHSRSVFVRCGSGCDACAVSAYAACGRSRSPPWLPWWPEPSG